ncbi:MAG: Spy0128 family protein [Bifidobacterium longum]
MSKYTRGLLAVILAVVLVLPAAAFAMLPEANARSSTGMDGPTATKIVDPDTTSRWQYWASGGEQDQTTRYVGRIWTDKTVEPAQDEKSDFVTTLSTISSTSDTTSLVTKPLDIVMVLDASGSMGDDMGGSDSTKRIDALKAAASSFIDTIAEQNAKIKDDSKQHQVSIVKFAGTKSYDIGNGTYSRNKYNYSQVMKGLTPCVGSDATELKNTVGHIEPAGATQADYGLELARDMSGRTDAQKVVVFFTDGSPTSSNGFESDVANDAVNAAKTMKDKGATIYTIGIFSGANPDQAISKASKENKFMHAVSNNYPNATSYTTNKLGKRTENSDFYKAASNADELKKVFDDISSSITSGKGSPTQIEDGYDESKSGYITFSDELGDFMQVDTFVSAQINGVPFDEVTKTTKGNTDTYEFSGVAKDLVITVERSTNAQQGDIVTVKIPASLIPLIRYHVDMENGIFERTSLNDIKPIQIKYTSSVKDAARNNLFTPDDGLKKYIEKHKGADNQTVYFLANKWSGGELGDVVAEFEPADTNSYYYFQKITPIYTDKECTQRATVKPQGNDVYYYKDEFVAMGEDLKPKNDYAVVMFEGHEIANYDGALVKEDGYWSFNKGTARLAYIDQLHTTKDDVEANGNKTETARDVLNPRWNDLSSVATSTHVHSHLGNNGKIIFSLATKPTTVATADFGLTKVLEGRKWADTDAFEFELSATSDNNAPMPDPATVTVTNADLDKGKAAINFGKITYAEPGKYTYEVREVKGDAGGITYSKNVATFKVTVTVNAKGELKADVEKTSGETKFTNTYSAKTETPLTLEATKTLTGRLMADGEFKFTLSYAGHDEVLLNATNKSGKVEFGPLTYTTKSLVKLVEEDKASFDASADKPTWTIHYIAAEQTGELPAGVSATTAAIDAYVTVADNGDGTLTATAVYGDAGNEFVNAYTAASVEASLAGKKNLQVPDGLTPADIAGKFTFTVTGEEGAPMPANASVTNDAKGKVDFGKITFTLDDLNKALGEKPEKREHTFTYTVTESGKVAGVTNDAKLSREVSFTVTDDGKGNLRVSRKSDGSAAFTFINTYSVTPKDSSVTDKIKATKYLTGRDMAEGEFSFELVEGEGKDAKVVATGKNAVDGKITMSPIEYTKAGTHTYTLREVKGNIGGITYDAATYTIETVVKDNGDGTLGVEHKLKDVDEAKFTNSYKPGSKDSSVTDQITVTKSLDGRDLKAGEFRFELVEGNNVVATGTNNADGKIVMDHVTYTAAGEHIYTLRETKAGATENGITYSTAEYTIVTTVTDNGDGTLSVEHKLQNAEKATFENTYTVIPKSSSVTDQITATKVLTGRDLKEGEFSFELVEGNDVVATGKNDDRGKIKMSPIEYTAAGKHTYTLCEVPGDAGNGITYDGKTYTIETTITDNGDGTLEAKHVLKGADEAKFNNGYKPNPDEFSVTDQITANKVLTGRELAAGEFSFELVEGEGKDAKVVATGTNNAEGKITMNAVKYDKPGKHTYTLREAKGNAGGITYSDAKFTIETTITDNGDGTLKAEHVLKGTEPAEFKNTYSVTPLDAELDFDLSKAIDGRDWTDSDKFSFTITAPEGTPLPEPATVTVSKKDAKDGIAAIKFGKIHYTAAGTYKYEIRENAGSAAGMTYDGHVATAEVTVTDNGKGVLTANVTKKESGRFTNTYRSELDYAAAGGLKLSKTLSGRPMTEGQFTFTVTPADEASAIALGLHEGANVYKSPATAEATVGLIDILAGHEVKFTQAAAGKTFTYTVAEKNDGLPGYTYDDAVRTVTIAIADDGAGTLTATTTVTGNPDKGTLVTEYKTGTATVESAVVPFVNSYSATTDAPGGAVAQVVATKTLTGRPLADGEFYFGIAYAGEKEAIEGTCVTNVNGQVSFGALHYTTEMLADLVNAKRAIRTDTDAKLAWTIGYTAFEFTPQLAAKGITAATPSFSFKVIVVDNGDGTLTATPAYDGIQPLFENVYGADAVDAALAGTKKLQAAEGLTPADIAGKFTFTVTADEAGAPMPEHTTVTNDAAGNVDFGKIHFTLDDLNRALGVTDDATDKAEADEADEAEAEEAEDEEADADADANADEPSDESEPAAPTAPRSHTFTYTVTESGSAPGVANDTNATRKVSYTVTDDGAGHLIVKRDGGDGAAFTFTNTYGVAPTDSSVTDQVKTVKRLTGRDLAAGEFTFELLEDGVTVASGTNDANGDVTLSPIRYEAPGTHTYTLREACPNALGLYKGVTYDGTTYTVVTTVSDNGDGTLTATHKLEGTTESAGFTNKYHAMPTQVSIGAVKVLEGRELKKDEFSFKLVGEDVESTVTNDADGKINFDKFEYDEPGTYVYTISEVKGDEAGMTYDKSVFTATVNVVDDGEGNLKANIAFTKGDKSVEGIVFNNTYKKPETPVPTPDPGTPKTVTNIVKTVKGFLPTTGDQQAAALLMAFVIAMAGVGALVWGIRKR